MLYALQGWVHAQLTAPEVDLPKPDVDSGDVADKGNEFGDFLASRSGMFWTLVVIAVLAWLISGWLKKPLIKGIAIGVIGLAIVLVVVR